MKKIIAMTLLSVACAPAAFGQAGQGAGAKVEPTPAHAPARVLAEGEDEWDFVEAVRRGDAAAVRRFLAAGMSPNEGRDGGGGEEVLLRAIRKGHAEVVRLLLEAGADVTVRGDPDLVPALKLAVGGGRPQIVKLLIEHGADVNARDDDGHAPLLVAATAASVADWPPEALRVFFNKGEGGEDEEDGGVVFNRTPKKDRFEMLRMLLDAGAEVNSPADDCGLTPLMVAAMYGSPEVARLLLDRGADPNVGTKDWNPLGFATVTVEELRKRFSDGGGGDPADVSDDESQRVVLYQTATAAGRASVADMLRRAGARERWEWPEKADEGKAPGDEKPKDAELAPPPAR